MGWWRRPSALMATPPLSQGCLSEQAWSSHKCFSFCLQILMLLFITNSAHCWMNMLRKWPNFEPNILIMKLRIWVSDGFCCHRCCLFPKTPHCRGAPSKKVWDCRIPGSVSNLLRKVEKGRKQISTARHLYSRFAIYLGFGILKSMMIELGWW